VKKKLILVFGILLTTGVVWMWLAPRIRVDLAAREFDPTKLELRRIEPMHKSLTRLPNGIEAGLLHLQDGTNVRYWFINRHVQPGSGTTRFDSEDGRTAYLHGCFCCEVWLPEFESWSGLESYIAMWDGTPP
jgi:hypothetical protein